MAKEILGERYRLDEKISESANVTVYRAWDMRLRRVVAVKRFRRGDTLSAEARASFQRTARALARFEHPNVVMVHDGAVADDLPYLVLEWLPGRTLRERLAHGPLPVPEAVATVCALASAVERAQSAAFPALNLDAGTILFDLHGQPKLTHFEWQRPLGTASPLARAYDAVSAAEQQVFALCVLLHELLTGQSPFLAASKLFRPSKSRPPLLPRELVAILLRALAPQPEERFDSPRLLAAALAPFARARGTHAASRGACSTSRARRSYRRASRRPPLAYRRRGWGCGPRCSRCCSCCVPARFSSRPACELRTLSSGSG